MKHKRQRNLGEISRDISSRLLDTFYILEILDENFDREAKENILIQAAIRKVKKSFEDVERCRKIIAIVE